MTHSRTRHRLALATAVGLLVTACGGPTPSGSDATAATDWLQGVTDNGFKWASGTLSLEVVDGRFIFNGKNYGAMIQGDRVRVTRDGALFVNGVERKPASG
ncbi:MAG TPA: hypothetical protein VGH33_02520 [Isosphaeraceae bacterium]|jgi:hypothetical protein